jgi:hypothetical protein
VSLTNERLVGHIAFLTALVNAAPIPLPGLAPNDSTAYNIRVDRQIDDGVPVAGGYVLTIGEGLAPPSDESADIDVTTSFRNPALWTNATVTDIGTDAGRNRLYQLNVVENSGAGGLVVVSDTPGITVRFSIRRVDPRRT